MLDADFSPNAIALLLACMQNRNIIVPVANMMMIGLLLESY